MCMSIPVLTGTYEVFLKLFENFMSVITLIFLDNIFYLHVINFGICVLHKHFCNYNGIAVITCTWVFL